MARHGADALSIFRIACSVMLPFRPALPILVVGVASDWLDGPLARHASSSSYGARLDLEADSLLTLGAAIAAVRREAPRVVLLPTVVRYVVVAVWPQNDRDAAFWDRLTGVAQMAVLAGAIARWPVGLPALVISAARTAALAARMGPRGRLDLTAQPAEPR